MKSLLQGSQWLQCKSLTLEFILSYLIRGMEKGQEEYCNIRKLTGEMTEFTLHKST